MIRISIDSLSVQRSEIGPHTGRIWLEFDSSHFPCKGWSDFPVVVAGWWAEALLSLSRRQESAALISFMDGPYSVEAKMHDSTHISLVAREGDGRTRARFSGDVLYADFVDDFIQQASCLLQKCEDMKLCGEDLIRLDTALKALVAASALDK